MARCKWCGRKMKKMKHSGEKRCIAWDRHRGPDDRRREMEADGYVMTDLGWKKKTEIADGRH